MDGAREWLGTVALGLAREGAALLAPPVCVGCRRPQASAAALALCPECLRALRWIGPGGCRRCALPAHGGHPCPARAAPWATAWSPVVYAGPAAALVRALKFRGALPLLDLMAAQLATNLPPWSGRAAAAVPPSLTIVPVPAVAARRRRRGFDVADGLAARVAGRLGLPVARPLERHGDARQFGATRRQRQAAGQVEVGLRAGGAVPAGAILLVDDVHTTGATLRACGAVLRDAGAGPIHVVTYARTT